MKNINNNSIGIFDSGIGGVSTYKEIKKLLPNENIIYYADKGNNPYGEKSDKELYLIVSNIVNKLIKKNVKMIVIACNTATTKCIQKLRKEYKDMIFVGTEPAIKVACDNNYKNILIMATPLTIKSERLHILIQNNKKDNQNITLLPCNELAHSIEINDANKIDNILKELFKNFKQDEFDSIVLACTHYPLIKEKIQKYFSKSNIIDGNKGVAKRVKYLLDINNLHKTNNINICEFILTKNTHNN